MMEVCKHCGSRLASHETIHAMGGELFCSKKCAVMYAMQDIVRNAMDAAEELYSDTAEEIRTADIMDVSKCRIQVVETHVGYVEVPASLPYDEMLAEAARIYNTAQHDDDLQMRLENIEFSLVNEDNSEEDDESEVCEWCGSEDHDGLRKTDLGMLCDMCITAIRSRGEEVIVYE